MITQINDIKMSSREDTDDFVNAFVHEDSILDLIF
jgi:hypothetical protein